MRRKVIVQEIVGAKLKFMSVVDQPATGATFKIIKSEENIMNKLTKLLGLGKATSGPQGFVVQKSANFTNVKTIANALGFDHEVDNGTAFIYQKDESLASGEMALLAVNDGAGILFKRSDSVQMNTKDFILKKAFFDNFGDSLEFDENEERFSLLPKFESVSNAFRSVVMNALDQDEEDPQKVMLGAAEDQFNFLTKMINELDPALFKMAKSLEKQLEGKVTKSEEKSKEFIEDEPNLLDQVQQLISTSIEASVKSMEATIVTALTPLAEAVDGLSTRVAMSETLHKKLKNDLNGKVLTSSDHEDETQELSKKEGPTVGLFDNLFANLH